MRGQGCGVCVYVRSVCVHMRVGKGVVCGACACVHVCVCVGGREGISVQAHFYSHWNGMWLNCLKTHTCASFYIL